MNQREREREAFVTLVCARILITRQRRLPDRVNQTISDPPRWLQLVFESNAPSDLPSRVSDCDCEVERLEESIVVQHAGSSAGDE